MKPSAICASRVSSVACASKQWTPAFRTLRTAGTTKGLWIPHHKVEGARTEQDMLETTAGLNALWVTLHGLHLCIHTEEERPNFSKRHKPVLFNIELFGFWGINRDRQSDISLYLISDV